MMRRRTISTITETQGPGEDAVHRGVGRQLRAGRLEPPTERRLEVAGDGDHHRRRFALRQLGDQGDLLVGPQRRLEDDDISRRPCPRSCRRRAESLGGHPQAGGGRPYAVAEKEVILDHVEPFAHTFAGYPARPFWSSPNVAIIAPGEWVEG